MKADLDALRGRFEESLLLTDSVLQRDPANSEAMAIRGYDLLKVGKPRESLATTTAALAIREDPDWNALAAAAHYQLGQYEPAAQAAQKAAVQMNRQDLRNPKKGTVVLTLAAAQARLGQGARAQAALAGFREAVPGVETISAIQGWMHPTAYLAGYAPLFDGLRLAGVRD